jgi:hypothetical protein
LERFEHFAPFDPGHDAKHSKNPDIPAQDGHVFTKCMGNRGALNLDGHFFAAVTQARYMDLTNRCGGNRLGLEVFEYFINGFSQILFDDLTRDFAWKSTGAVMKAGKFITEIAGKDVPPHRDDLGSLDPHTAETLELVRHHLRQRKHRILGAFGL